MGSLNNSEVNTGVSEKQLVLVEEKLDQSTNRMTYLKLYGPWGLMYLNVNEGHFYRYYRSRFQCVDSQFFVMDTTKWESTTSIPDTKNFKCDVGPGQQHHHPIPSRESVENTIFRWACKLRVIKCCQTESLISQSITFVVSTWPQPHTAILSSITSVFEQGLRRCRKRALENHPKIRQFLEEFGDETFDIFRQAFNTLPFWTEPVPVVREGDALPLKRKLFSTQPNEKKPVPVKDGHVVTPKPKIFSTKTTHSKEEKPTELKTVHKTTSEDSYPELLKKSLHKFEQIVDEHGQVFKKIVENGGETKIDVDKAIAVVNRLFSTSRLEQFLNYKLEEMDMIRLITNIKKTVEFRNTSQIDELLTHSKTMEYIVILRIPPLDAWTKKMLTQMEQFCNIFVGEETYEMNNKLDNINVDEGSKIVPWHMVQEKRKNVLDQVRQLAEHAERNQHLLGHVHYFITFGKNDKNLKHWYVVYEEGKLLRNKISRLPGPPTGLSIRPLAICKSTQSEKTAVRLEWTYEDFGYPYEYLIEYRNENNNDWKQYDMSQFDELNQTWIHFSFQLGLVMEFRVAAATCIGLSQFSQAVNTRNLDEIEPTTTENQDSIELKQIHDEIATSEEPASDDKSK